MWNFQTGLPGKTMILAGVLIVWWGVLFWFIALASTVGDVRPELVTIHQLISLTLVVIMAGLTYLVIGLVRSRG